MDKATSLMIRVAGVLSCTLAIRNKFPLNASR